MKRIHCLIILLIAILVLNSCSKTTVEVPFDDTFKEPYTTGIIKFQFEELTTSVNGGTSTRDSSVSFTSRGTDTSNLNSFGFWDPSVPWFQVMRMDKRNDFYHSAVIFFVSTNIDTLQLPYTFKAGDNQNAQINYTIGPRTFYDNLGNPLYGSNTYGATTYTGNFKLTLLSNTDNRMQGTFSGIAVNQDGFSINITQGLFDVEIIDK